MDPQDRSNVRTVLILKSDRLCADHLRQLTLRTFPLARVVLTTSIAAATGMLAVESADLLVVGAGALPDGDIIDFLSDYTQRSPQNRRVLVVTARCENLILAALRTLPINGVFDSANDEPEQLVFALRVVASGARYWSPTVVDRMQRHHLGPNSLFRLLTSAEQLVLSVIGDGCDDSAAATTLGLSPSTVSTVRRELHRKLGVQHRGELVRVAAQNGFVRFTPNGVVRPGFALLAAACPSRNGKRILAAPAFA